MKKSIFTVALILGAATTTFAQDKEYGAESGDWAVGVDATPFLNYFGNFIGGAGLNTAPTWNFLTTNQTITGKYFTASDMAYRASVRIGFGSTTMNAEVGDDAVTTAPTYPALPSTVTDTYKSGYTNIGLAGGVEYRKGSGRLVGIYGGELGISLSSSSETYTYGNAIVPANGFPTTNDFGSNLTADTYGNGARVTSTKSGSTFGLGIRGFIGAEYFILPKMSLGGEFGWGIMFMSTGASTTSIESTDGATVGTQDLMGSKMSSFGLDTDSNNTVFGPAGSLRLTFHFQ